MALSVKDKLVRAKLQTLFRSPFFSYCLFQMPLIEDSSVPTACTNGKIIKFNPKWADSLTEPELTGVMSHEAAHILFGHNYRMGAREPEAWNISCLREGTLITMADGSVKPIELINPNEYVLSPKGASRVIGRMYSGHKYCHEVRHNNGTFHCTSDHKLLTKTGFIETAKITNGTHGISYAGNKEVYTKELQAAISSGVERINKGELLEYSRAIEKKGTTCQSEWDEEVEHHRDKASQQDNSCLLSRDNRRRGDNLSELEDELYTAVYMCQQHIIHPHSVDERGGVLCSGIKKQPPKNVFQSILVWLPDGGYVICDASLFSNQETASSIDIGAYIHSSKATIQSADNGSYARDCLRNSQFEQTWIKVGRRSEKKWRVFDLITEHQVIIAEGLLVHNCDLAINHLLKESGFSLPKSGCFAGEGKFANMPKNLSAEEYYDRLPPEMKQPQPQGGQGDGDPGGCGGVEQAQGSGQGKELTRADIERLESEQRMQLAGALQQGIQAGNMPAGLQRLVEELLAPKINWREVLAAYLHESTGRADYSWKTPNRRYGSSGFILPSLTKDVGGEIAILGDTSGSIGGDILNMFAAEMNGIVCEANLSSHVVWWDTEVANVEYFEAGDDLDLHPKGGGGSDVADSFKWVEENTPDVCAVVVLTDGYITGVPRDFEIPTIWCLISPNDGFKPAFGQVLVIEKD